MTDAAFKKLQAQWYAAARADGFQDIESPSGAVPSVLSHGVSPARTKVLAQLEQDRDATERLARLSPFEQRVWALHLDGVSNRGIARQLCVYRKLINETIWKLKARAKPERRSRRQPDSMRSHGVALLVRLGPSHVEALDHVRTLLNINGPEALRAGIVEFAKRISSKKGALSPCVR